MAKEASSPASTVQFPVDDGFKAQQGAFAHRRSSVSRLARLAKDRAVQAADRPQNMLFTMASLHVFRSGLCLQLKPIT